MTLTEINHHTLSTNQSEWEIMHAIVVSQVVAKGKRESEREKMLSTLLQYSAIKSNKFQSIHYHL